MYAAHRAGKALARQRIILQVLNVSGKNFGTDVQYKPIRSVLVANRGTFFSHSSTPKDITVDQYSKCR